MTRQFCPACFDEFEPEASHCPACGIDLAAARAASDYESRLIRALDHPVAEVRLGVIEALRMRRAQAACDALLQTALSRPADVVESLAVVGCLAEMLPAPAARRCLERLASDHRARSIREAARVSLP